MGELVNQGDRRPPAQHGVEIHLLQAAAPVVHHLARDDLQVADHLLGQPAAVTFDEPDHDVGAPLPAPAALVEHGVGLPDAGGGAQVDAEAAGLVDRVGGVAAGRPDVGPWGAHAPILVSVRGRGQQEVA